MAIGLPPSMKLNSGRPQVSFFCEFDAQNRSLSMVPTTTRQARMISVKAESDATKPPPRLSSSILFHGDTLSRKRKLALASHKPLYALRFLWQKKSLGIGLDQMVIGCGPIPLSPFYFWPTIDAWEELKAKLDSMPKISKRQAIILLNQATDIINLWQQKYSVDY